MPVAPPAAPPGSGRGALLAGALAALLASSCCLGPLVLLGLGISGAWIANLSALEPWRPLFIAVALAALALAARRLWPPTAPSTPTAAPTAAPACAPGQLCALPPVRRGYRLLFGAVSLLVAVALAFPWLAPLFY